MACIGINGFGRIGRLILKATISPAFLPRVPPIGVNVVAINDPKLKIEEMVYLLNNDSVHPIFRNEFQYEKCDDEDFLIFHGRRIPVYKEENPIKIPWSDSGAETIVESSGELRSFKETRRHLRVGGKRVVVTCQPPDDTPIFIMGVNHLELDECREIFSTGSCTLNCIAPVAKIINDEFEIDCGFITALRAVKASQKVVDMATTKSIRGGRSVFNTIPRSTGLRNAFSKIIPDLKDKIDGIVFKIPLIDASLVEFTFRLCTGTCCEEINNALKEASKCEMKGLVKFVTDELASSDVIGSPYSAIVEGTSCVGISDEMFKITAWFDNEFSYALRVVDLIRYIRILELEKEKEDS